MYVLFEQRISGSSKAYKKNQLLSSRFCFLRCHNNHNLPSNSCIPLGARFLLTLSCVDRKWMTADYSYKGSVRLLMCVVYVSVEGVAMYEYSMSIWSRPFSIQKSIGT